MAELSAVDYAVLAVLQAEDREISNTELDRTYGFRLVGAQLQRLLADQFIVTNRERAPYRHVIGSAGRKALARRWTLGDDRVEKGERRTVREKQLWAGLVALQGRPDTGRAEPADLDGRIRAAYAELAAAPGAWVDLTALRERLADVPKGELDRALKAMLRDDAVRLEPEPFGHRVGDEERRAAVHVGGEDRHKLAIGPR